MTNLYSYRRTGCLTCRESRIKCDELRPSCLQCRKRNTRCAGYAQQLKWKDPQVSTTSPPPSSPCIKASYRQHHRTRSAEIAILAPSGLSTRSTPFPRNGLSFQTQLDHRIFLHWAEVMPQLVYPNPEKYHAIIQQYLHMLLGDDSALLPAILACTASHMAIAGLLPDVEFLERRQAALIRMMKTVSLHVNKNPRNKPSTEMDASIAASMMLTGMEVTQGSPCQSVIALLQGVKHQWDWRRTGSYDCEADGIESAVRNGLLMSNIKMMAYFDIMCCVPCARAPTLEQRAWDTYLSHPDRVEEPGYGEGPDVVFGYCEKVLPLIGQSSSLINRLFTKAISLQTFLSSRKRLLHDLRGCCEKLPPLCYLIECPEEISQTGAHESARNHNACISAAYAHSLATQIFLWRAYCHELDTPVNLEGAVDMLASFTRQVPLETSSATMMLWPMFVIGCESQSDTELRQEISRRFQMMFSKQKLMNIQAAYDALEHRVWAAGSVTRNPKGSSCWETTEPEQSWVWHCWREKIDLCLA
jgi:hypothetical protein